MSDYLTITMTSTEESTDVQEALYRLGYEWNSGENFKVLYLNRDYPYFIVVDKNKKCFRAVSTIKYLPKVNNNMFTLPTMGMKLPEDL